MNAGRVVVTGANGIIGRAVVSRLQEAGLDVIPIVRAPAQASEAIVLDLAKPDVTFASTVSRADAVVHLAAAVPHAARHGDTDAAAGETRRIDETVHRACADQGCYTIYASTCGLYDRRDPGIKDESAAVSATSPYFRAKLAGEALMASLPQSCVMRVSAVVGPGLRRGLVLAKFIERARAGETIELWGSGRREQDFVAAEDIAEFILAALSRRACGLFNVASGQPVTMRDLAETVVAAIGAGSVGSAGKADPLEGETARYSVARAARTLGWRSRVPLHDAIAGLANAAFPA